jgi:hypothetical protein
MTKSYTRQISLRRWFPPHDRFAACVGRLCFLREDFALEMSGIQASKIKKLDGNDVVWRKMYFWRQLVKSLGEIRSALQVLQSCPGFKNVFNTQSPKWRQRFKESVRKLERDQDLIKNTRDSLGGHVLLRTVEQALNSMPGSKFGYLEVGKVAGRTHYRFVGEIAVEMLVAGVDEREQETILHSHLETIATHLGVFSLIDDIFKMYVGSRRLLK